MSGSTFKTNPRVLKALLADCESGKLQLPDFQRGWVWDEGRIIGLTASIARAFPVGALMTLESSVGVGKQFAHRTVEGAPDGAKSQSPNELLLDGQQRMTSLYQSCLSKQPVRTTTARGKQVERYFYIDIRKALADPGDFEAAILSVPADRCIRTNFNRDVVLDLSTPELEYEQLMYPLNQVFNSTPWLLGLFSYATKHNEPNLSDTFQAFNTGVLQNFVDYQTPVIALGADTSTEAVCLVFEKVNTGGKVLDAFELLTAMYAANSFRLRDDWLGPKSADGRYLDLQHTLAMSGRTADREEGVLAQVSATNFLQAVTLLYSKQRRLDAEKFWPDNDGKWPAVRATRQTLLTLPLNAYLKYREPVLRGFQQAAEVPAWIAGGPEPDTVARGTLNPARLLQLRTRNSAAYKGINVLLMRKGAKDFRTGQPFDVTAFFDENVDIHHIFPQDWCNKHNIPKPRYDNVVNKTPLSYRTNRIIGGVAPSEYLAKLERGSKKDSAIPCADLDGFLVTHAIPVEALRADDFDTFMAGRQHELMQWVCDATGQPIPAELASATTELDVEQSSSGQFDGAGDDRIHGTVVQGVI